jgi:hypothetical protein
MKFDDFDWDLNDFVTNRIDFRENPLLLEILIECLATKLRSQLEILEIGAGPPTRH